MYRELQNVKKWLREQKKGSRIWFLLLSAAAAIYIVGLLWLLPEMMEAVPMDTKYWKVKMAVALLMLPVVWLALTWAAYRCRSLNLAEQKESKAHPKYWIWFLVGFGVTFAWMMLYFYAYFPGSFDWDNLDQWWQLTNHQYDTWHPVFHTLIITLFSKIVNHYGFAVFMQLFLYSMLCGYLLLTMARWKFPRWGLVLTEVFLAFNPQTHRILLFMWKDSMLTLFMLLFASYLINTWLSNGQWLKKKRNLVLWILVLISISMVRHNSILFTIPFLVLALFWFREIRKESALSLVLMLAGMMLIKYPVYDLVGVTRPEQTYVETVGVPMTVLCNIHETAPESLDKEAAAFLDQIGPQKRWQIYEQGNYNSLKFVSNANAVIKETQPLDFLKFTARTVKNAPGLSLQAVYQVTRMVWDVRGDTPWHGDLEFQFLENEWDFGYIEERAGLRESLNDFDCWVMETCVDKLFSYNGLHLLALILSTLFVFLKKGKGLRTLCITLPLLAYSYGTMLLLCGPTYRFFHFNSVIFLPLCLLLFKEWKTE